MPDLYRNIGSLYEQILPELDYVPEEDLDLVPPAHTVTLSNLGYPDDSPTPTRHGVTGSFKILSRSGVEKLQLIASELAHFLPPNGKPRKLREAIYRFRFIRDLCRCPRLTSFLSSIVGIELMPCSFILQRGHLNYAPPKLDWDVVAWHTDTINFSLALLINDPSEYKGGQYEYFLGTREEAKKLLERGDSIPAERVIQLDHTEPGCGIFAQGDYVMHRVAPLQDRGERIVLVNAYMFANVSYHDPCTIEHLKNIDIPKILKSEWIKHKAYRTIQKLSLYIESMPYSESSKEFAYDIENILSELNQALKEIDYSKEKLDGTA